MIVTQPYSMSQNIALNIDGKKKNTTLLWSIVEILKSGNKYFKVTRNFEPPLQANCFSGVLWCPWDRFLHVYGACALKRLMFFV